MKVSIVQWSIQSFRCDLLVLICSGPQLNNVGVSSLCHWLPFSNNSQKFVMYPILCLSFWVCWHVRRSGHWKEKKIGLYKESHTENLITLASRFENKTGLFTALYTENWNILAMFRFTVVWKEDWFIYSIIYLKLKYFGHV